MSSLLVYAMFSLVLYGSVECFSERDNECRPVTGDLLAHSSKGNSNENFTCSTALHFVEDIPLPGQLSEKNTLLSTMNAEKLSYEEEQAKILPTEKNVSSTVNEGEIDTTDVTDSKDDNASGQLIKETTTPVDTSLPPSNSPPLSRIQLLIKSKAEQLKCSQNSTASTRKLHGSDVFQKFAIGRQKVKFSVKVKSMTNKLSEKFDHESSEEDSVGGSSSENSKSQFGTELKALSVASNPQPLAGKKTLSSSIHKITSSHDSPKKLGVTLVDNIDEKEPTLPLHVSDSNTDTFVNHSTPSSVAPCQPISQMISYPSLGSFTNKPPKPEKLSYEADSTIPDKQTEVKSQQGLEMDQVAVLNTLKVPISCDE